MAMALAWIARRLQMGSWSSAKHWTPIDGRTTAFFSLKLSINVGKSRLAAYNIRIQGI
jgi:hypothetical protein